MERGIKYAKVLAQIDAPQNLIDESVASQGKTMGLDKSYAINEDLKVWLKKNLFEADDESKVIPISSDKEEEDMTLSLPRIGDDIPDVERISLRSPSLDILESQIPEIVKSHNFFDTQFNPEGSFPNFFVDNNDGLTVTDKVTGIMWQRGGCDITSIRKLKNYVAEKNDENFAGYNDWRIPTMLEALSLMDKEKNSKDLFIHPCFSVAQPFIFLTEIRSPGGYWFCDFKQGTVFWASGTIPGGFGRLCRNA